MTITFVGHGYVGLVTAAVFADLGNTVWVIGHTPEKIENLKKGIIPIYEPGLEELVKRNLDADRLLFTLEYDKAIPSSDVVFIAVGTPPLPTGEADLSVVFEVAKQVASHLGRYTVVITKSTVPIGTNKKVKEIIENNKPSGVEFDVASVPEFLREGQAISDTFNPDRVVIGTESKKAEELLVALHAPLPGERVLTSIETAEMVKYASNAFLATKISFANAIAQLSEKVGADGVAALVAVGIDKRIGRAFLNAGVGYGGSCFPKDVKALIKIADNVNYNFQLLKSVEEVNKQATLSVVEKIKHVLGENPASKKVAILGLAFKPDTDDMRDAPSITVIRELSPLGVSLHVYDPIAAENAKKILNNVPTLVYANNVYDAVKDADVLVVVTEWNEFKELDLHKVKELMKNAVIIDGRNIYDPKVTTNLGFTYYGVGR